jgi:hypothetical protein
MFSFRFNIKQLLLLFVLLGLIGGLLSAVFQRPYRISFSAMDVSEATEVALAGPGSLVLVDLQQSRMGKRRRLGSYRNTFSEVGPEHLKYLDDDRLLFLRKSGSSGYRDLIYYRIATDEVANQVVLPNWDWQHDFSDFGAKVITVQQANGNFSFYETLSGRRIRLQLPTDLSDARQLVTDRDGKRIALIRDRSTSMTIEVWDLEQKQLIAKWERSASGVAFVRQNGQLIVVNEKDVALLDIPTQAPVWERALEFKFNPDCLAAHSGSDQIALGGDDSGKLQIEVLNSATGATVSKFSLPSSRAKTPRRIRFIDRDRLAVSPIHSDLGLTILDTKTGGQKTIGRFYRWSIAVLFTCAFVLWGWGWGRMAWREEQSESMTNSSGDLNQTCDFPPGPADSGHVRILPDDTVNSNPAPDSELARQFKIAWNLMAIGGVFAIAWSVIPMFFFGFGEFDSFLHQLFYLRVGVALFGLAVGLMATSRGFGRYRNWVNLTAGLQILNLIGFDLLNFVCGIFELSMLNRNQSVQVAKLIHPVAERVD